MKRFAIVALAQVGLVSTALAHDRVCHDEAIYGDYIDGNLVVTGWCDVRDTIIDGHVYVEPGGDFAGTYLEIGGMLHSDGALRVRLEKSSVYSHVDLSYLDGPGHSAILNSWIGGDVYLNHNSSGLAIGSNTIVGHLLAYDNYGKVGICHNTISADLACSGNTGGVHARHNEVGGSAYDQCADSDDDHDDHSH